MPTLKQGNSDAPQRKRSTEDEDEEALGKTTGVGWGAVAAKKVANEEAAEAREGQLFDFFLYDGESATIQILEEEPYCFEAHQMEISGKFQTIPCQIATKKSCVLCDMGIKRVWKGGFKILDMRGKYDKTKKKHVGGDPVERKWAFSHKVGQRLIELKDKLEAKSMSLTTFQLEVSRRGSTARDTIYTIDVARDDEDNKIKATKFKSQAEGSQELYAPPSNNELAAMGINVGGESKRRNKADEGDDPF